MDTSFAPDTESSSDSDDYMTVDHRKPFSSTVSNAGAPLFHQLGTDALFGPSSGSQQTHTNPSYFDSATNEPTISHTLASHEGGRVSSSHDESQVNIDGDELSARLLLLAERTPMSREDILFGSFMEVEGPAIIPQWQHSAFTFTPSESSLPSSVYTEDSLVTPLDRTVSSDTLPHSFEPIFPRYFQQQSSVPRRSRTPGSIDRPYSPLSYKAPLIEQWKEAALSPNILFDCGADPGTNGGLSTYDSFRSKVAKRARDDDDDDDRDSQMKKRCDNKWRMYC
jgi:hypothetical protein